MREYIRIIEKLTGLELRVVTGYPWPDLMNMLRSKELDVLPMMYWTEQRGREFNLTNPYITIRHYVFVNGRSSIPDGMGDLEGKTIAVPAGYAHIEYLNRNHPGVLIRTVDSLVDAMDAVITGKADAFIENTASVAFYTERQSILGLVPAFPVKFEVNNVHMAVRKDWPLLREILQKALDDISTIEATAILSKWTGSEAAAKTFLTARVELTAAEIAYLQNKQHLSACVNSRRMPIEGFRDPNHQGMTSDYLGYLADALHVPIRPVAAATWTEIRRNLIAGRCDLVPLALRHADGSDLLDLSNPYIQEKPALATRVREGFFESLSDLSGVTLGVVQGYTQVGWLRQTFPDITFVETATIEDGLADVAAGRIYGLLDYVPTLSYLIRRSYEGTLKISSGLVERAPGFSVGVSKSEPLLASAVAKVVETIPESQKQAIHRKWVAVSIEQRTDLRLLFRALAILAFFFVIFVMWYASQRRHRMQMRAKNKELEKINRRLEEQTSSALHLAYHDQLTGLANRAKLLTALDHAIQVSKRSRARVGLLFLDLDRFKYVNDSLGHDIGDRLLQAVAARLNGLLRETDTLCRFGGDEFVIILEVISDTYSPSIVSQRIIQALKQPFDIDDYNISIGTSIGIAVCPDDSEDLNTLLKYADAAMYLAKETGRNNYRYYRQELSEKARRRMTIESDLRRCQPEELFSLAFQPVVDLATQRVVKAEALLRWNHSSLGEIPPDEFIPIAEEIGAIIEIGEWVLAKSCQTLTRFSAIGLELDAIAVNVSSVEFMQGDIANRYRSIIARHSRDPRQIEIEITERYMFEQDQSIESELQKLRHQGHRISVDDFGIGYSSLSYMKRLPLNIIKIDRSFVEGVPDQKNDSEIFHAILSLSKILGYKVVAEGVETSEQLDFLLHQPCDYAQGYFFSPPIPEDRFLDRVAEINARLSLESSTRELIQSIGA